MKLIISEQLSLFISFLRSCTKENEYYSSLLSDEEKKRTDLLHALELEKSGYRECCKISTKLRKCLLERRKYKDMVEELAPIASFLAQPKNKDLLDKLSHILGETRKAERYHKNRTYKSRFSYTTPEKSDNNFALKDLDKYMKRRLINNEDSN